LWKTLGGLFGDPPQHAIGYVYVEDDEPGLMAGAQSGATIRIPGKGPPWIVVDSSIDSIVIARWPGRLWRVAIVEPVPAGDQLASGGVPGPEHGYTRAAVVRLVEELPLPVLFGSHGQAVVKVIDAAMALDAHQAQALAEHRHADAEPACARVWRAWLGERPTAPGIEDFMSNGTLMMTNVGRPVSPVNRGLMVVHGQLFKRAVAVAGEAATEEDDTDIWLVEPWRGASSALIDAALAFGTPEHMTPADRAILMQAWVRVFGA
jgi:hypothetical protein